jgi:hypothetical protein
MALRVAPIMLSFLLAAQIVTPTVRAAVFGEPAWRMAVLESVHREFKGVRGSYFGFHAPVAELVALVWAFQIRIYASRTGTTWCPGAGRIVVKRSGPLWLPPTVRCWRQRS